MCTDRFRFEEPGSSNTQIHASIWTKLKDRIGTERNLVVDEMSSPAGRCAHWSTEQYTSPPSLAGSEFIPSSWRLSRRLGGWCWLWRSIGRWMDVTGGPPVQASVFLARAGGLGRPYVGRVA